MNSNGKISLKKIVKNVLTIGTIYYMINNVLRTDTQQQNNLRVARVAQLVERDLAKVEAAGSSPVSRSFYLTRRHVRVSSFFVVFLGLFSRSVQL